MTKFPFLNLKLNVQQHLWVTLNSGFFCWPRGMNSSSSMSSELLALLLLAYSSCEYVSIAISFGAETTFFSTTSIFSEVLIFLTCSFEERVSLVTLETFAYFIFCVFEFVTVRIFSSGRAGRPPPDAAVCQGRTRGQEKS